MGLELTSTETASIAAVSGLSMLKSLKVNDQN
jgi:hypothetical protein